MPKKFNSGHIRGLPTAMKVMSICMPSNTIDQLNFLVARKEFSNFSEAVRFILKLYLENVHILSRMKEDV